MGRDTSPSSHYRVGSARISPWTPQKSPRSQPQRGAHLGPSEGSVVPPTSPGRGSHLPISSTPGCYWEKGRWYIPLVQHTCVSPHSSLQPSHSTASPEASQGTHRVNRASASCFGSFCLSSANSLQPSWKAASLTAGRAGGWAWEAPRVSTTVPLSQPLPDPESTHMCYGVVHQETHTLSLLLEHTQAYTPIFKQSCCTKESKHTQIHGVCAHQCLDPELCTSTQINASVSQATQQHTHTHTRVHVP